MPVTRTRKVIDDAGAETVVRAAEEYARSRGLRVVIAVVDPSGELVRLGRTAGAQVASSRVAVDKARTAAIFIRPSREIEEQVSSGRVGALALHGARALTGGIPLVVDGQVVGAVGTSGETPDEDEDVSKYAASVAFSASDTTALTQEGARAAASAAAAEAARRGVAPVVAVVDAGGSLLDLFRPDAAQVASVGVATDKARTAAIYRRPSKDFEDQVTRGRASALHLARAVPLQGGMPILIDGEVAGAIGVSGASSADEDQELAVIGKAAAEGGGNGRHARYFAGADQFARGGILLDEGAYKIDAGRRSGPGAPELHEREVDVMRVVSGRATVVTGGEIVGDAIEGGVAQELGEGDVIAIPQGVPHQFTDASDPFLYFVVKVAA
jgi:uncharacterized protein GlcG (DUF336 family)